MGDKENVITTALGRATDGQIREEIERRQRNHLEEEKTRIEKLREWVYVNLEVLLEVTTEHGRTSCDDKNTANADRGCERCILLDIRSHGFNNEWIPEIRFNKMEDDMIEKNSKTFLTGD